MHQFWDNMDDEALIIGDTVLYPDDELTPEQQDLVQSYVEQIEEAREEAKAGREGKQLQLPVKASDSMDPAGKSHSTTKPALSPAPDDWTVQDARKALVELFQARLDLDKEVRKEGGSKVAQAYRAKRLNEGYERKQRELERWLKDIQARERIALREKGGRPYGMKDDEANIAVSRVMDEVLAQTNRESYDFKARMAERLRKALAKLAEEGHDEVHTGAVREAVYRDLVQARFIEAFEPLDY